MIDRDTIIKDFRKAISDGKLKNLYGLDERDIGPEVHNCTIFSTVFIKEGIRVINDQIYLFSYFDNENSVNRDKYNSIRSANLHKMEPIPVCKIPN